MTGARANAGLVRKGNDECDKEHGEDLETPTVRAAEAAQEAGQTMERQTLYEAWGFWRCRHLPFLYGDTCLFPLPAPLFALL